MNNLEKRDKPESKNPKPEKPIDRKDFLKKLSILAAGAAVLGLGANMFSSKKHKDGPEEEPETIPEKESSDGIEREKIKSGEYRKIKAELEFEYKEIYPDLKIERLEMLGDVGKYGADTVEGKLLRTLRFQNVTRAVEKKYNLPKNIILAMIMEESTGADLVPNARDDGGFGLCHMQGITAKEFGLKTFEDCNEKICDKGHAKRLRQEIEENHYDRKKLINKDDRLHPILNLDAVGRMLACYMSGPKIKREGYRNIGPLRTAVARYSGTTNFPNYWPDIIKNMKSLKDEKVIEKVRRAFNDKNQNLVINDEPADFDIYIKESLKQNFNYGLESYKRGTHYLPKNSEEVLNTYKSYLD
ncbi:MAG: hypothetical protein RI945_318 [Candidatus Parcubacteria bacterium]|jgi:hypothetical protein